MNLQVGCDLDDARAGARCFGGTQRPGNEHVLTDEVRFCLSGSNDEPRFICGCGSGHNTTMSGQALSQAIRRILSASILSEECKLSYLSPAKTGTQSKSGGKSAKFLSCATRAPDLNLQLSGGQSLRLLSSQKNV